MANSHIQNIKENTNYKNKTGHLNYTLARRPMPEDITHLAAGAEEEDAEQVDMADTAGSS